MVANRVCTTERSSAKSRTTASVASSGMGVPATAVIAVVGAATCSTSRATSVVVPLRLIATMRS